MDKLQQLNERNKEYETKINLLINELKQMSKNERRTNNGLNKLKLIKQLKKKIKTNENTITNLNNLSNRITQFGETKDDASLRRELDLLVENQKLEEQNKKELEEQNKKELEELNALEALDAKGLIDINDKNKSNLFTPEEDNKVDKELEEMKREKAESKRMMNQDFDFNRNQIPVENQEEIEKKQKEAQIRDAEKANRKRDKEFQRQVKEYELTKKRKMNQNNKTRKNKNKNKEIQMVTKKGPSEDITTPEYEAMMAKHIKTGFKETLKPSTIQNLKQSTINANIICPAIFKSGKNVTKKYYFPSEFPNLTKLKSIVPKGGRKTRRNRV